ncbi:MAG: hypothetical protein KGD58_05805 [Candidatus Lokiarchaeota archaeon]|nr:hypothetical protein [Candidatus Lokiarchaeota archaeon]
MHIQLYQKKIETFQIVCEIQSLFSSAPAITSVRLSSRYSKLVPIKNRITIKKDLNIGFSVGSGTMGFPSTLTVIEAKMNKIREKLIR